MIKKLFTLLVIPLFGLFFMVSPSFAFNCGGTEFTETTTINCTCSPNGIMHFYDNIGENAEEAKIDTYNCSSGGQVSIIMPAYNFTNPDANQYYIWEYSANPPTPSGCDGDWETAVECNEYVGDFALDVLPNSISSIIVGTTDVASGTQSSSLYILAQVALIGAGLLITWLIVRFGIGYIIGFFTGTRYSSRDDTWYGK